MTSYLYGAGTIMTSSRLTTVESQVCNRQYLPRINSSSWLKVVRIYYSLPYASEKFSMGPVFV